MTVNFEIKVIKFGWMGSMDGEVDKYWNLMGNLWGSCHFEGQEGDGQIILMWILKKEVVKLEGGWNCWVHVQWQALILAVQILLTVLVGV
jgi:hypothetical protein